MTKMLQHEQPAPVGDIVENETGEDHAHPKLDTKSQSRPLQAGAVQQLAGMDAQQQAMGLAVAQIKQKLSHMYTQNPKNKQFAFRNQ